MKTSTNKIQVDATST